MFKHNYTERVAKAGVLAALSAVPISAGIEASGELVQILCVAVGMLLWLWALALLLGMRPPASRP